MTVPRKLDPDDVATTLFSCPDATDVTSKLRAVLDALDGTGAQGSAGT